MLWLLRYRATLEGARQAYHEGMRFFRTPGGPSGTYRGGSEFYGIVSLMRSPLLFEQLEDGDWTYRCDELTKLFALAAYRLATLGVEEGEGTDNLNLCLAIQSRPEVILPLAKREGMSPKAHAVLDEVLRDPLCYFPDGYRSDRPRGTMARPDAD